MSALQKRIRKIEEDRLAPQTFGQRLRFLRHYENLSQDELAAECDISKGFLSDLENDKAKRLGADILHRLSIKLRVTMDFLYTGENR